uniref:helicase HerA-like domain-containing protein n=1 Tax=Acetatifactor sp. TaxID=1872090 RepID=UPI0040573E68
MYQDKKILVGMSEDEKVYIYPKMANRHGMIAGATGTGKTVTLKVLAESFSDCGVPVFLADVKGDLAGMCRAGSMNENVQKRVDSMGLHNLGYGFEAYPTTYWDVYGEKGLPLRTTVSEMGPLLLSRILELNETQTDIMTVIFKIADDQGLLLIDTKDLRAMLQYVGDNAKELSLEYGNMSKQSLAAIIRAIIALESEGGDQFFGEPALNIADWFCTDCDGKGTIQVLDCQKLINFPTMYSTFLLWMMSELFEALPEAGDRDKPKMVFFFDEAHMLFDNASKALLEKIEQVVKLIRSKGVGIYFITQNPRDIPDGVLAQLGNKVQHALHAYTPAEQKAAKAAAMSFRENPEFDTYETMLELGIGEGLISVLDEKGVPTIVKKATVLPPQSQMGPISDEERDSEIKNSLLYSKYIDFYDRDSAYEFLQRKSATDAEAEQKAADEDAAAKLAAKEEAAAKKAAEKEAAADKKRVTKVVKSVANSAGGTIGREIGNTIGKTIGGSFGKKLGGNIGASLGRGILSTLFKF